MAKLDEKIGFIGGGNMAFAIGSGLINREFVKTSQVLVSGPNLENLARWRALGITITDDNYEVLDKADIIFICVKPHILTPMATQLRSLHSPTLKDKDKLFVSVLAGVKLKTLEEVFNYIHLYIKHLDYYNEIDLQKFSFVDGLKMIRTMPNTPMQIGEGITVYSPGSYVKQQDLEKLHLMLNSLGIAQQVPESMIDAVSGVAGCGPAFVYTIIEALADGGVKQGVPRQMALQFAAQMLLGAAKMVLLTGKHPAVLRDEVTNFTFFYLVPSLL